MKAAADRKHGSGDFYLSTLAPLDQRRGSRFCAADLIMLTVLFVEIGLLMRLILAK